MNLGKALRLRRIFANGRALIVDCDPCPEEPLAKMRLLARAGVDAVVLTPGLLDLVAEELGALSVILRTDGGARRAQQLVSVQAAMEMGVEAVSLSVAVERPGAHELLERFGRITEDARRLGMPVIAEIAGQDWLEVGRLAADYGADVIDVRPAPAQANFRSFLRKTGRPFLISFDGPQLKDSRRLQLISDSIESAAQGIVLGPGALEEADPTLLFQAVHGIVHQGISVEEARAIGRRRADVTEIG